MIAAKHLAHGQTNFLRMLWKFSQVYSPQRQIRGHQRPVKYQLPLPKHTDKLIDASSLYIHRQGALAAHG